MRRFCRFAVRKSFFGFCAFALLVFGASNGAGSSIIGWGNNSQGQISIPVGLTNAVAIAAGNVADHNLALRADRTVVAWGNNDHGQATVPAGLTNVVAVAGGQYHNLALTANRTITAWGYNSSYYTNGPTGQTNVPAGLTNVLGIGAGWYHSLAVRADGTVAAWGGDEYGQSRVPFGLTGVVAVAGGPARSLALKADGKVVAWGTNISIGSTITVYPLNPPADLTNAVAIAGGYFHTLALRANGTVVAWGANQYGQSTVPAGLTNIIAVAAGAYNSFALTANGTVVGWGLNPAVPVGLSNVVAISAGYYHAIALLNTGPLPPAIVAQPANRTAIVGENITFNVSATGALPLSYQWRFMGTDLPQQTNATMILQFVQFTNAGEYAVVVTNAYGSVTSTPAVLVVTGAAPFIVVQPQSQSINVGSNFNLSVTAGGTPPFAYQWQKGDTKIAGATNAIYSIGRVETNHAGVYSVIVRNVSGSVTSSNALLTVIPTPECAPIHEGLVAWWRFQNNLNDAWDANNGLPISPVSFSAGKVAQALTRGSVTVLDSPSLRLTNALTIEAWVNPANLYLASSTIVSKYQPPFPEVTSNQSSFYLGTTNNGRLYLAVSPTGSVGTNTVLIASQALPVNQWTFVVATYDGSALRLYANASLVAQTNYSGGIFPGNSNLGIGAVPSLTPYYYWPWSGAIDEVALYRRALTEGEIRAIYQSDFAGKCSVRPAVVLQPQNQVVPLGEDTLFSVSITGTKPLTYQWLFNGTNLVNATNATLLLEKVQPKLEGNYSVAVSNEAGTVVSSNASLALLPAPVCAPTPPGLISWWPADGFASDAMGTNNANLLSGATYATGKVGRAFSLDGISSRVFVEGAPTLNFGSNVDFSIEGWIKALPPPSKGGGTNANVPIIEKRDGTALTSGVGYSLSLFQGRLACWLGTPPGSSTNVSFYISSGPDLRDGMFHHVALSLQRASTNGGNLYVDGQLVLSFDATTRNGNLTNNRALIIGGPWTTVSNSYFSGLIDELAIYRRALSANEIQDARVAGAAGKCKVPPSILVPPASQRVTVGSNATFSVSAAGSPQLRYQWLRNGGVISGATNATYTFRVELSSLTNYSVRVTNVFGSLTSSIVTLTINVAPVAFVQRFSLAEDIPIAFTLRASDPNMDPLTYLIERAPAHGTLSGSGPDFTYTPFTNYYGQDSFTFKASDGLVDSAPAVVNIDVLPINDAPTALSQSVVANEDTPLNITLSGTDVDGDVLSYLLVTAPSHGTLTGAGAGLTYVPSTNYNGFDSLVFKSSDGVTSSAPATISITVLSINDAPFAVAKVAPLLLLTPGQTNQLVLSLNNSNAEVVLDGSASWDVENDPLTYEWFEGASNIANGSTVTARFELGFHTETLRVRDGIDAGTDVVSFEVITAAEAINLLNTLLDDSQLPRKHLQPLLASLNAAAASFNRNNLRAGMNQLQAFQSKLRVLIAPGYPVLAAELEYAAQQLIDSLSPIGPNPGLIQWPARDRARRTIIGVRNEPPD